MSFIIDTQGFKDMSNNYIFKEVAVASVEGDSLKHFILKPPYHWKLLSTWAKSSTLWLRHNYHHLPWECGDILYEDICKEIEKTVSKSDTLYVKGEEKIKWFNDIGFTNIYNIEDLGCPALKTLQMSVGNDAKCDLHKNTAACAKLNVLAILQWYRNYKKRITPGEAIEVYFHKKHLMQLSEPEVASLPKEFILRYACRDIEAAWDKLPEELKTDENILQCRRCKEHYNTSGDCNDSPPPMIKNCLSCTYGVQPNMFV